jgi:hypothetical protein
LIERRPNSFRHRLTAFGFRAALFFARAYNHILRPGLAAGLSGLRTISSPLTQAFDKMGASIRASVNHAHLGCKT